MISWNILIGGLILLWIIVHTFSYGKWTWGKKNYIGSIVIFIIDIATVLLPIYLVFIK